MQSMRYARKRGVLAGGDMVKYLGQDETPLQLRGDNLKGKKEKDLLLKDGTILDQISTDNIEFKIVQTIIKLQLEGGETGKWNKIVNTCMVFYEETFYGSSTSIHHREDKH